MKLNRGIERLILLLSILVGTTIVVMTAQSDYTLGGNFASGAEVILGHLFLWTSGFASVWVVYGVAVFVARGFDNIKSADVDEVEVKVNYHPLPKKKAEPVQAPPSILSWKEQIDRVRRASSRQRIRLIDNDSQTTPQARPARSMISGDNLKFHCRFCSQKIVVPKQHAGKRGQCLKCKKILLIPGGKPKVAIGTGMSAVSQVLARAKKQAESRKAAWDHIQAELADVNKGVAEKKEVIAEVKAKVKAKAAMIEEAIAPVPEEKIQPAEVSEKAKETASMLEQVKAEARVKAMQLTDALEKLKTEMEEKIRAQALAAAEIAIAEAKAHAEPVAKPKAKTAKAKPKTKVKPKTVAKAKATTKPKTAVKARPTAKAKATAKAKITKPKIKVKAKAKASKPKSIDIKELVAKAKKTKKAKTVKA